MMKGALMLAAALAMAETATVSPLPKVRFTKSWDDPTPMFRMRRNKNSRGGVRSAWSVVPAAGTKLARKASKGRLGLATLK